MNAHLTARIALVACIVSIVAAIGGYVTLIGAGDASIPACVTEDSRNCFWDAELHGNGEGRSFVDVDGVAFFVETGR